MKKNILLILMGLLCSCSKNSNDKSKTAIENYLSKHMLDYKSYEPVEFSKIDSAYSVYEKSEIYLKRLNEAKVFSDSSELIQRRLIYQIHQDPDLLKKQTLYLDKAIKLQQEAIDGVKSFKPSFIGYKQIHSYRGKNAMGGVELNADTFYLSKDLSSVISIN